MNIKIFLALASLTLAACSDSEQHMAEESSKLGEADARGFVESAPGMSVMQIEGALVEIRANEYAYREAGHDRAADAYVSAFETYLKENADSLAKLIFNE